MGYRPFGKYRQVAGVGPVGDQWPEPPDDVREAVDERPSETDFSRLERAIYRWLARPRLWPKRHQ